MTGSIKIAGGLVVGGPRPGVERADILVRGDGIVAVGPDLPDPADTVIDARGLHVSPGFIDMHSHSDFSILANVLSPEKLLQGVTTEVVGNCGLGIAPSNDQLAATFNQVAIDLMNGQPMPPLASIRAFHETLAGTGHAVNIASLVPHGNVRALVMGVAGGPPTADQMGEMQAMVAAGMEAGAFGMSTGLVYPPGSITPTSELVELCKALAPFGGFYASHVRNEATGVIKAVEEAIAIGKGAGIPVHVSHLKVAFKKGLLRKLLGTIDAARRAGIDITADAYPYVAGATNLGAVVLPTWVYDGGPEQIVARLMDPVQRRRVIGDAITTLLAFAKVPSWVKHLLPPPVIAAALKVIGKKIVITHAKHSPHLHGKTLVEALRDPAFDGERGILNKTLRLLANEEGNVTVCIFQEDETTLAAILSHPEVMIGTDSIQGHPRTWGTYPRVLGRHVRDGGLLPLHEAIRKMTAMPAVRLGLHDRGRLAPGCKADIVAFDLAAIQDNATFDAWNLPPSGIVHVLVNGAWTVKDGVHLGVKAGRVLRREGAR